MKPTGDWSIDHPGQDNDEWPETHDAFGYPKDGKMRCAYCFPREQFTHGEIKREPDPKSFAMIPLCRKHSFDNQIEPESDADMGRMEHDDRGDN